jgi:hypothetical protein
MISLILICIGVPLLVGSLWAEQIVMKGYCLYCYWPIREGEKYCPECKEGVK